jgi:hypothetical protein
MYNTCVHDKNNLDRFEMNLFNMMQSIRFVDNGGGAGQQIAVYRASKAGIMHIM